MDGFIRHLISSICICSIEYAAANNSGDDSRILSCSREKSEGEAPRQRGVENSHAYGVRPGI